MAGVNEEVASVAVLKAIGYTGDEANELLFGKNGFFRESRYPIR